MPSSGWAVAQTYGACEHRAVENLLRQSFEAFCPLLAHPSRSDLTKTVRSPLFPCYVFVRIDVERQRWQSINSTFGVIRLLTNHCRDDPAPLFVDDAKVGEIVALSQTVEDPLPVGTLVRVRARRNAFGGQGGVVVETRVDKMDRRMRASVLMHVFNRDMILEFAASDLERVAS